MDEGIHSSIRIILSTHLLGTAPASPASAMKEIHHENLAKRSKRLDPKVVMADPTMEPDLAVAAGLFQGFLPRGDPLVNPSRNLVI